MRAQSVKIKIHKNQNSQKSKYRTILECFARNRLKHACFVPLLAFLE